MKIHYDPNKVEGNHVLLYYREEESDKFFPGDRYLKRLVRPIYNQLHRRSKVSGFGVSFRLLRQSLEENGYVVHCNDYALARANPEYPVGLVGGRALLKDWRLPNPAVLGPSLYDQPGEAPDLFADKRFRKFLCLADWHYDLFVGAYGDRCAKWFAGIDANEWPDTSASEKTVDFLVYDKVRWDHDHFDKALIEPILAELSKRGLSSQVVRYRHYDHETFHALLGQVRGMIFLCENETQGLAYQEAMASNVPILAWDRGYWADPQWREHFATPPAASSVPFFSEACGEHFSGVEDFSLKLDVFLRNRPNYRPRDYVIKSLSMAESAQLYASTYFQLIAGCDNGRPSLKARSPLGVSRAQRSLEEV